MWSPSGIGSGFLSSSVSDISSESSSLFSSFTSGASVERSCSFSLGVVFVVLAVVVSNGAGVGDDFSSFGGFSCGVSGCGNSCLSRNFSGHFK